MQIATLALAMTLPLIPVASSPATALDQPTNPEATAAYRAIPAVAQAGGQSQDDTVDVKSCQAANGQPGVICKISMKKAAGAPAQDVTVHFSRGPDSAWVGTLEQTAP
jgi:hypothetical protein